MTDGPLVGYRFPLGRRRLHALLAIGMAFDRCVICERFLPRDGMHDGICKASSRIDPPASCRGRFGLERKEASQPIFPAGTLAASFLDAVEAQMQAAAF